jgi:hypothetical protein
MATKSCENCQHVNVVAPAGAVISNGIFVFQCRRNPPPFVKVEPDWWCGEFGAKAAKTKKKRKSPYSIYER